MNQHFSFLLLSSTGYKKSRAFDNAICFPEEELAAFLFFNAFPDKIIRSIYKYYIRLLDRGLFLICANNYWEIFGKQYRFGKLR